MNTSELKALISLLDDPDEDIYTEVKSRLLSFGEEVIPDLENLWEFNHFEPGFQDRILDIVHQIQYNSVRDALIQWNQDDSSLLKGVFLVNRYQYPEKDFSHIETALDKLSRSVWLELNDNLTAFEQVRVFNYVIFSNFGFKANKTNYHSPQNSYIGDVLDSRRGNPLSLSIVYQLVAERIGLPIKGVNLPNHFILAYMDKNRTNSFLDREEDEVLFYINPFSNGSVVSRNEITQFLAQLRIDPDPHYFLPCSNRAMVKRMLNNLIYSYARQGLSEKVDELKGLEQIISD